MTRCVGPPGWGLLRLVGGDVVDGVADGLEVRQFVVRNLDPELVLGLHRDLDHRELVDVQVVGEGLVDGDVGGGDAGDLFDDLAQTGDDVLVAHGGSFRG